MFVLYEYTFYCIQKAENYDPWGDEVKAFTKYGKHCTQTSPLKGDDWYTLHQLGSEEQEVVKAGSIEDCLYTHVYTPDVIEITIFNILCFYYIFL